MSNLLNTSSCPACGAALSQESGSKGLCLSCLMELALESPSLMAEFEANDEAPTVGLTELEGGEEAPTLVSPGGEALSEGRIHGERYRLRSVLGKGGMGEVWRAYDLKLRLDVALKSLRAELLADEHALEVLRQEVRTAREVISPNVCRVFDLQELDDQELISMEYVDGTTLQDILKNRGPLELNEAREIASQFLAGLEAIHDAGLVHRDIKPENLMITRTGRVVVMDFGIARALQEGRDEGIAGTPAYMSPEQARGKDLDPRADLFSAGVVLAEMVEPSGVETFEARRKVWEGIHQTTPQLTETPWTKVIAKSIASNRDERFASAAALARALEEVTLRAAGDEDAHPYPGLATFQQEDAEYFFGRELEVEALWKKLRRPQMLAVIGPSGAGKSSFLRAGLLASLPESWGVVLAQPGSRPFAALARALMEVLPSDQETVDSLLRFEESDTALALISDWRQRHEHTLIVLDQFEELFTQNPESVQHGFAELVGRLPLEADVHVLLSMRDDFLFHCQAFEPLAPIFSELSPIGAPTGAALRRAIVQPALKCGYRFEDESLVEEMLTEVEGERGSLPMVAFAASKLWQLRDRDEGALTREAYEQIGGVGGALAQHAEQTLEKIGTDQIPIVRELFRNLVTAEGTRATRDREELLSVFAGGSSGDGGDGLAPSRAGIYPAPTSDDATAQPRLKRPVSAPVVVSPGRESAAHVLDTLIDARLLTSYEVSGTEEEGQRTRIEIIHESLLSHWPRLVRWQIQDADSAQLRDQLRQAAQVWLDRGRPTDLLWAGTSYQEFGLWRQRYGGGLSTAEEAFAKAMASHAERRRRQRRMITAAVITVLVIGLGIVGMFWRQAALARDRARLETLRAEASQLLTLGRQEIDRDPTAALAYATAALDRADEPVSRLFALEALWRGPPAFLLDTGSSEHDVGISLDFSPDGKWLAGTTMPSGVALWPRAGGVPKIVEISQAGLLRHLRFGPDSDVAASLDFRQKVAHFVSVPGGKLLRSLSIPSDGNPEIRLSEHRNQVITFAQHGPLTEVTGVQLDGAPPKPYGEFAGDLLGHTSWAPRWVVETDPTGDRLAFVPFTEDSPEEAMRQVYVVPLDALPSATREHVGSHQEMIMSLAFHPGGELLASGEMLGEIRLWSLTDEDKEPRRSLHAPGGAYSLGFSPSGSRLAATSGDGPETFLWDLEGPPDAGPLTLRGAGGVDGAFHPDGHWFAAMGDRLTLWPIKRRYPIDLQGHEDGVFDLAFLPDGSALLSTSADGTLRLWPLSATAGSGSRVLFDTGGTYLKGLALGPRGEQVMVNAPTGGVWLLDLKSGERRMLERPDNGSVGAFGPRGRLAVIYGTAPGEPISVLDLETGDVKTLSVGVGLKLGAPRFTADGRLVMITSRENSDERDLRIWNLEDGSYEVLLDRPGSFDLTPDGRFLLASRQSYDLEPVLYDLVKGTSRPLSSHGEAAGAVALDVTGQIAVTRRADGLLQVGPVTGESPHLLVGSGGFGSPVVSPDGQWIAAAHGNSIRLWPMPDMARPPLHTLPLDQLLAKLRALTNLRVIADPESESGWGLDLDRFTGWEEVPTW